MNNEYEYSKDDFELLDDTFDVNTINDSGHKNIIGPAVTLSMLRTAFAKFQGNYLDLCAGFDQMNEMDQKLFILYSCFHLDLIFRQEDIALVFTDKVMEKADELAGEFSKYGSEPECDLRCSISIYGPQIRGTGNDISIPLEIEEVVNDLDFVSIEDLATAASKASYYENSEEKMFRDLNDSYQRELVAFKNVVSSYVRRKTA